MAFIRLRKKTFDRHVFLITNQIRGETVKNFLGKLRDLAEKCDLVNKEETLIRHVFMTILIDPEVQKKLLKQTTAEQNARACTKYEIWDTKSASKSSTKQDSHSASMQFGIHLVPASRIALYRRISTGTASVHPLYIVQFVGKVDFLIT